MSAVVEAGVAAASILDCVGHTPLVRLTRLPDPAGAEIYVKLEGLNPSGSVKDRSALGMIDHAEATGALRPGMTIIESSSGNLGIAIAQIAAVRGYRAIIVADDKAAAAQLALMQAYGARVELVTGDPPEGLQRARWHRVRELAREHPPAFIPDQYANPTNPHVHARTTGPELLEALGELSAVVSSVSTGGHLSGIARHLRPLGVEIVAVDIDGSTLFRPGRRAYLTNGVGLSWIPENLAADLIDEVVVADDRIAFETARALARHEGILVGPSSGAAVVAALRHAVGRAGRGPVVAIAPDRGDRYADSLFDDRWCRGQGIEPRPTVGDIRAGAARLVPLERATWIAHREAAGAGIPGAPAERRTTASEVRSAELPELVVNPRRGSRLSAPDRGALEWHRSLPGYSPTPLRSLPTLARELGLRQLLVKDETSRFGLPSFKILGASWAATTLLATRDPAPTSPPILVTATDGNHGRAVARVARGLGATAIIFLPAGTTPPRVRAIRDEGASVRHVPGTYDRAVEAAASFASATPNAVLVSDTSAEEDDPAARATIEGYGTIFSEIEEHLRETATPYPDVVMVQVGVGSLAAAAVRSVRSRHGAHPLLVGVEPASAACAFESIRRGARAQLRLACASDMVGLVSGVLSASAWPTLRDGLDLSMTIADAWCPPAVDALEAEGIMTEATGAAGLAGLMALHALTSRGVLPRLPATRSALVVVTEGRIGGEATRQA